MYKVLVMLSSYNGERYIIEQVNSIYRQNDVHIDLVVRDDGSTDNTVKKLNENFPEINIKIGENIGWKKSFFTLLYDASQKYDYYAFSDQDDVWLENKIKSAIDKMYRYEDRPCLYYSMMTQVDDNLNILEKQQPLHYPISKPMVLFQNFVQGSTMVFNKKLLKLAQKYTIVDTIPHDIWLPVLATYTGKVIFDESSYILYRIHSNNVTVNMNKKYWKSLIRSIFDCEVVDNYAKYLKEGYSEELSDIDLNIISKIANYRNHKISLLFNKNIRKLSIKGTIMLKLAILFGRIK